MAQLPADILHYIAQYAIELRIAGIVPRQSVFVTPQHRKQFEFRIGHALRCRMWKPHIGGFVKFLAMLPCRHRYLVVTMVPTKMSARDRESYIECCQSLCVKPQWQNFCHHFRDKYYVEPHGIVCIT